ncbi:glutathione S-transferase N-terminal domain-containing protein [Bradyrhizobium sp. Cp5.3]|uniref:glutathione S-transferase N-terminal domain-containing protein n=1 Tax=Bradyrhizobium sp. Cp5.3 TaxID=443598 RepID=UPI003528A751
MRATRWPPSKRRARIGGLPRQAGTSRQPEHLTRYPFGRMPVLDHGDFRLYETQAILRYLDRALPQPAFDAGRSQVCGAHRPCDEHRRLASLPGQRLRQHHHLPAHRPPDVAGRADRRGGDP